VPVDNQRRREIIKRDNGECQSCGLTSSLRIHHIKREDAGGSDDPENLQTLCFGCHKTLHSIAEDGAAIVKISLLDDWPPSTEIRGLDSPMKVAVLEHLKDGRELGMPWGYTSASIAAAALDTRRQYTSRALNSLHDAGWIEKVEPEGTGVYRFVNDPRADVEDK